MRITQITRGFPLWAVLFSLGAYFWPAQLAPLRFLIVPFLMIIMLCMGVTLTAADFLRAVRRCGVVGLGVGLQYFLMPLTAWLISRLLGLPPELTVGMVLVGSVSGGTASNVICYLARGDVALSITMTFLSTLLAVLATPVLTWLYVGQMVPVPVPEMLLSVAKIVVLPIVAGLLLNRLFHRQMTRLQPLFPFLAMVAIVFIIGVIVALNQGKIAVMGPAVALAVVLHNATGLAAGYGLTRRLTGSETLARTVAIEVGMQNSGLAVALAIQYFSPLAALPGALFSIWHNLSGSLLAGFWSRNEGTPEK